MKKSKLGKILIIGGIVIVVSYVAYLFYLSNVDTDLSSERVVLENPYGQIGGREDVVMTEEGEVAVEEVLDEGGEVEGAELEEEELPRLVELAAGAVVSYDTDTEEREISIERTEKVVVEEGEKIYLDEVSSDVVETVLVKRVRYIDREDGAVNYVELESGLYGERLTEGGVLDGQEGYLKGDRMVVRYYSDSLGAIQTYVGRLVEDVQEFSCPYGFSAPYGVGDSGREVELLQDIILNTLVPFERSLLTPGKYDENMRGLVAAYQRMRGVTDDGVVGSGTMSLVIDDCIRQEEQDFIARGGVLSETEYLVEGYFLEDNITEFVVSPNGNDYFYLVEGEEGVSGYLASFSGDDIKRVFSSSLTEWLLDYVNEEKVMLTTKPAANVPGFAYWLDVNSGAFERIIGGVNGLTTKSVDSGRYVVYGGNFVANLYSMRLLDVENNREITLAMNTLPEKCGYDEGKIYCGVPANGLSDMPDDWYRGEVSFSDSILVYDIENRDGEVLVSDLPALDVVDLRVGFSGQYLLFKDKSSGGLYAYSLE